MVISKFNRLIAKHGRVAFVIIGILIVVPFVFFYGASGLGGGGKGRKRGINKVGRMYGSSIDPDRFKRQLYAAELSFLLKRGKLLSRKQESFDQWVKLTLRRMRMLREARQRGLTHVTDSRIAKNIREQRLFQKEGKFSKKRFNQLFSNLLQQPPRNISKSDFDQIIKENIIIDRLKQQVKSGVFVSPEEVKEAYKRQNEQFAAKYKLFDSSKYTDKARENLNPSPARIKNYFEKHSDELQLPPRKVVNVARFSFEDYEADVAAEEAKEYYEKHNKRFKGKDFADVKDTIKKTLRRKRQLTNAEQDAVELLNRIKTNTRGKEPGKVAGIFKQLCAEADVTCKTSGPFLRDSSEPIPNIGKEAALRRRAYALNEETPLTEQPIRGKNAYFLASWQKTLPAKTPRKLTDYVKTTIKKKLVAEKVRNFFKNQVAPYREKAQDGISPQELLSDKQKELMQGGRQNFREKFRQYREFAEKINAEFKRYYVPAKAKIRVALFPFKQYRKDVEVTTQECKEYYQENSSEYNKKQVRTRHIFLNNSDKSEKQMEAQKKLLKDLKSKLENNEADFASLAKKHSQNKETSQKGGDTGFFSKSAQDAPAFADEAFKLEQGDISDIIETEKGFHLVKLVDKRSQIPFEEVQSEIRQTLKQEKARTRAKRAATRFETGENGVYTTIDNRNVQAHKEGLEVFNKVAENMEVKVTSTDWFTRQGPIPELGRKPTLAKEAQKLSPEDARSALSPVIKGKSGYYLAYCLDKKDGHLPQPSQLDPDSDVYRKAHRDLIRKKAKELALKEAEKAYETLRANLAETKDFEQAASEWAFEETAAFTRAQPPQDAASPQLLARIVPEAEQGTLLQPRKVDNGAILVYVHQRKPASMDNFEKQRERITSRLRREKETQALEKFYQKLRRESNTQLKGRWAKSG